MALPAGPTRRIYVNQTSLRANQSDGGNRAVITVCDDRGVVLCYGTGVGVHGGSRVLYKPGHSPSGSAGGPSVYVETEAELTVYDERQTANEGLKAIKAKTGVGVNR